MVDHSKLSNYEIKLKRDVKSFVWEHFGDLQDKSTGKMVDTNNVKHKHFSHVLVSVPVRIKNLH